MERLTGCMQGAKKLFSCIFQFRAMQPSCRNRTKSPLSPPLVQCFFWPSCSRVISCVTANNIAIEEGETVF